MFVHLAVAWLFPPVAFALFCGIWFMMARHKGMIPQNALYRYLWVWPLVLAYLIGALIAHFAAVSFERYAKRGPQPFVKDRSGHIGRD